MNNVVLLGRLVRDPENVSKKRADKAMVVFTLAVDSYKDHTDFIDCTAFGKTGEIILDYFGKGNKICVSGELYTKDNVYKKKGVEVTIKNTSVNVTRFDFCEKKAD